MANAPGPEGDGGGEWVELINCGDREIDLAGWILTDPGDPGDVLGPWQIEQGTGSGTGAGFEPGTRIEPGGLAIILDPDGDPVALGLPAGVPVLRVDDSALGNGLRAAGDRLILLSPGGAVVDSVAWGSDTGDGVSWERQVDGAGLVSWAPSSDPTGSTPGRRNSPSQRPLPQQPPVPLPPSQQQPPIPDPAAALLPPIPDPAAALLPPLPDPAAAAAPPPPPPPSLIVSVPSLMDGLIIKLLKEVALQYWQGIAGRLDAETGSHLPDQPFGPETQIWLRTVEGGGVMTARTTLDIHSLRSPPSPFRGKVYLRVDRSLPVGRPVAGVAFSLGSNRRELHLGPLR
ncbi:lamin tail domain-containing protein, partial [Gemmatimonadota bacterium]